MQHLHLMPVLKPDGNKLEDAYEVLRDFEVEHAGRRVCVPAGFQYDGASIPMPAWGLVGTPFDPRFMRAAVVHDWLYHTHTLDRGPADALFRDLLLDCGVNKVKAQMMYCAVDAGGGWYWTNDEEDEDYLRRLARRIQLSGRRPEEYGLNLEMLAPA